MYALETARLIDHVATPEPTVAPASPTEEDMLRAYGFAPKDPMIYTPEYCAGYEEGFTDGGSWRTPMMIGAAFALVLFGFVVTVSHSAGLWHFGP